MRIALALLLLVTARASAQSVDLDPCSFASFPDEAKRKEHGQLLMRLSYAPWHNAAQKELTELGRVFVGRKVGNELFGLWNDMNRQVQAAVRAPELDEVQDVLMVRCLNRLKQFPAAETERVRRDIETFRTLLALSDADLSVQWKARLTTMLESFGTPEAANQTLRINLGLPVPH